MRDPGRRIATYAALSPLLAMTVTSIKLAAQATDPLPRHFEVVVIRQRTGPDHLLIGRIEVDGKLLGTTYEDDRVRIPEGTHPAHIKYFSQKYAAPGPLGTIGKSGDFILELDPIAAPGGGQRENILFHGGQTSDQTEGCILLGGVPKGKAGAPYLPGQHPLGQLRQKFYGADMPAACPNTAITVRVVDERPDKPPVGVRTPLTISCGPFQGTGDDRWTPWQSLADGVGDGLQFRFELGRKGWDEESDGSFIVHWQFRNHYGRSIKYKATLLFDGHKVDDGQTLRPESVSQLTDYTICKRLSAIFVTVTTAN